jgi:hypothetical protein
VQAIVAEHIAPAPETICPLLTLTQEPVSVRRVAGGAVAPVPNDATGYLYLGAHAQCPQGRLLVAPNATGQAPGERLEVHYCTSDEIPQ